MATRGSMLKVLKPLVAGLALAFLLTAFVDKPASVHFQPENPYASKQAEIVEPQAEMVMEKNIMKLGSPLSAQPVEIVEVDVPVKVLEIEVVGVPVDQAVAASNATDNGVGNGSSSVMGEVETP